MKLVSWNCRGLESKEKLESIRHLIESERPQILLLQETKMKDQVVLQEKSIFGRTTCV
jgi:exonuclease III